MKIIKDNIITCHNKNTAIVVPVNSSLDMEGRAILDDPLAILINRTFPDFSWSLGDKISLYGNQIFYFESFNIYSFPIKYHFKDNPSFNIIENSCAELALLDDYKNNPSVLIPKVGCVKGGIKWSELEILLEAYLPDITVVSEE
jgi:hypothetical protein